MADEQIAALFRKRAHECRQMLDEIKEPDWRGKLVELAQDLEREADRIAAQAKS